MLFLLPSALCALPSVRIPPVIRTITATIAAELAEAVFGGHHYRILFMLGAVLFAITFISNLAGDLVIHRLKAKMEGKR